VITIKFNQILPTVGQRAVEIALEEGCKRCDGTGRITRKIGSTELLPEGEHCGCNVCGGKGVVPTKAGAAILELVEKYGGKA
jgi:hypothetical protein